MYITYSYHKPTISVYVINYKIEMGWLGFVENHKELKRIRDEMVVCDNVSKGLIKEFCKSGYESYNQ